MNNNFDCNDLAIEFWYDSYKFFDNQIEKGTTQISQNLDEGNEDDHHTFKIVLKNKKSEHTVISSSGEILSDVLLSLNNICFNDVNIDQLFFDNCCYKHNFNGNGDNVEEPFFGNLGCNGVVEFSFTSPFYMWLLENM